MHACEEVGTSTARSRHRSGVSRAAAMLGPSSPRLRGQGPAARPERCAAAGPLQKAAGRGGGVSWDWERRGAQLITLSLLSPGWDWGGRVHADQARRDHPALPTEEHQARENPVRCAGEVEPQVARGLCPWRWSLLGPPCQAQRTLRSCSAPRALQERPRAGDLRCLKTKGNS